MRISVDRLIVEGPHGTVLPATSFTVASGSLTVVHGEPNVGVTALGLALAGRITPSSGAVRLQGSAGSNLRDIAAVIDAPGVSEPDEALPVSVVIGEELALAKKSASRENVLHWLDQHDAIDHANARFEDLEPSLRTRLLTAAAASRRGVGVLVLVTPDRHTSDLESWFSLTKEYASEGFAVVVLIATTPPSALPITVARIGELDQPEPLVCREVDDSADEILDETDGSPTVEQPSRVGPSKVDPADKSTQSTLQAENEEIAGER